MSLDPNLPGQLLAAARVVQAVLQDVNAATGSAAMNGIPGWQGSAANRYRVELGQLQSRLTAAAAALTTLQNELTSGASLAGQALAREAADARAAAAQAQAAQVYGPPWPGPGYGGY